MWAVETTALDRGSLHRTAREVLSESPSQKAMTARLTMALAKTGGVDPNALGPFVARVMEQPEFVAAFAGALDGVQEHVVQGASGPITLDPTLVTEAVRVTANGDQQVNATVLTAQPIVV